MLIFLNAIYNISVILAVNGWTTRLEIDCVERALYCSSQSRCAHILYSYTYVYPEAIYMHGGSERAGVGHRTTKVKWETLPLEGMGWNGMRKDAG